MDLIPLVIQWVWATSKVEMLRLKALSNKTDIHLGIRIIISFFRHENANRWRRLYASISVLLRKTNNGYFDKSKVKCWQLQKIGLVLGSVVLFTDFFSKGQRREPAMLFKQLPKMYRVIIAYQKADLLDTEAGVI